MFPSVMYDRCLWNSFIYEQVSTFIQKHHFYPIIMYERCLSTSHIYEQVSFLLKGRGGGSKKNLELNIVNFLVATFIQKHYCAPK